ncbi:hypothetical protein H5410_049066 [Solanum commersonii]|uniref:Uncharacterized protein n=1 Tax=Solanum commersonii TaxID=4109 RepID=A0A9J5XNH7_SOLCO|nr:hypothetical protein H5410_049066 [Solanum commersonii]
MLMISNRMKKWLKRKMIFLLENSEIQRKDEPWKIFQRYLINRLYFPGESYKTHSYYETILMSTSSVEFQHFSGYNIAENVYNFSKMIIKQVISIEDWGISSMKERQMSLNKILTNFTYWNYIHAFSKVLCYNNERHKHSWFVKVCSKIFEGPIPNWFLNWWSYHRPTIKILPEPFLKLYKEWVKNFPSHGFTNGPQKSIRDYGIETHKILVADPSVKHIARRISIQDGNTNNMINDYLEEVRRNILLNITHYEKSDTSMRSETSEDAQEEDKNNQPGGDSLQQKEDFLFSLKGKEV